MESKGKDSLTHCKDFGFDSELNGVLDREGKETIEEKANKRNGEKELREERKQKWRQHPIERKIQKGRGEKSRV